MKHYTIENVMAFPNICYSMKKVKELFAGRPTITLLDVLDMDIPVVDKVWAAERMDPERFVAGPYSANDFFPWLREQLEREKDPVLERLEKVEKDVATLGATLDDFMHNHFLYNHKAPALLERESRKPPEKPKTCGGCRWPWKRGGENELRCEEIDPLPELDRHLHYAIRTKDTPACPKHEAIK